jgi:hypothetical protein
LAAPGFPPGAANIEATCESGKTFEAQNIGSHSLLQAKLVLSRDFVIEVLAGVIVNAAAAQELYADGEDETALAAVALMFAYARAAAPTAKEIAALKAEGRP